MSNAELVELINATGGITSSNPLPVYLAGSATPPTPPSSSPYTTAVIDAASSGANTLVAGTAQQTIRVYRIMFTLVSGTVIFKSGTTALTGAMQTTGLVLDDPLGIPLFTTAAGDALVATLSGANQMSGMLWYIKS